MKVIAKIDGDRVLCEVDIAELAFLHGFRSSYDTGFNKDKATTVGAECNLKKMVSTSQFVRSVRPQTLKKTKEQLEEVISKIDDCMETISGLEIFTILSEDKPIGEE